DEECGVEEPRVAAPLVLVPRQHHEKHPRQHQPAPRERVRHMTEHEAADCTDNPPTGKSPTAPRPPQRHAAAERASNTSPRRRGFPQRYRAIIKSRARVMRLRAQVPAATGGLL